ncbi:MAG: radical SAM domain-containing protein [Candidatus Nanopelagicales bacterium]
MKDLLAWVRAWELTTRPVHPQTREALERRWEQLPEPVRTPAQTIGRHAVGCEGTHGVFPRCNLACTPCYHSRDANRVAVDGTHTTTQVSAQLGLLRRLRGPHAHAQLIGGEVSLLSPEDHAGALAIMREHGREPMSMSHGDFDYDYLRALALGPDGRARFDRLSFAGHFDMLMFGRRGIARPVDEASLNLYRARFVQMFVRLRRAHGVRYFLAHNMTVTPTNLPQVAQVIRDVHDYGFGMFSFQPAAFVGDDRRWHEDYRDTEADQVWAQIEAGAGSRLPFRAVQSGDTRCNRTAYGCYVGEQWYPFLDDEVPADLDTRDAFFRFFGGVAFTGTPKLVLTGKLARVVGAHPSTLWIALRWTMRMTRRVGLRSLLRHRIRPVTFVMHSFMDAADVGPAWDLMQRGQDSDEPRIAATQQRLKACVYAMAHPETGELVPACVQHSVLDPAENVALRALLPLTPVHRGHADGRVVGVGR